MKTTVMAMLAALALAPVAATAATLTNGSFEDGTVSGRFTSLAAGSTALTGWTIGAGGIDHIGSLWQASDGSRSLDMSRGSAGTISQVMTGLVVGRVYQIEFDMSGNVGGGNTVKSLSVLAGGEGGTYSYDTAANGTSNGDMKWQTYQYFFTAGSENELLTFTSNDNNAFGAALDNVQLSVAAVPLPASVALLGLGLAGLGAMRRRKSS